MAEYKVQLPEGQVLKLEGPDGASDQEIIAQAQALIAQERPGKSYAKPVMQEGYGFPSALTHAATLGADTIGGGIMSSLANAVQAPLSDKVDFDPVGSFEQGRTHMLDLYNDYTEKNPVLSTGASLLGGLIGAPGKIAGEAIKSAPSLLSSIARGLGIGGVSGAAAGATSSQDLSDAPENAVKAGGIGALIGGAIPAAVGVASPVVGGIRRLLGGGEGLGLQRIAEALEADGITPEQAGATMDAAHGRGVPRMLADTGENTQRLAGAVYRQPGSARTQIGGILRDRQRGQGERLQNAISRDMGPTTNVADQSDALIKKASAAAAPLYDAFRSEAALGSIEMESLLGTPAARSGLTHARTIAANDRRDPTALGFRLGKSGEVDLEPVMQPGIGPSTSLTETVQRNYTPETIDYVKRGMDDVLEPFRDPITRKLNLTGVGKSADDVRKSFIAEADRLYPDTYAAARKAFEGPARERDALHLGQSMVDASDGDIERAVSRMADSEKEQFALGMRSKLSENLNRRVDGADKVGYLSNSPQRRSILSRIAGPDANLERFAATLGDEDAAGQTYRTAMTGSPTSINLADDAIVGDDGIVSDALGRFVRGSKNSFWGGVTNALAPLLDVPKFGAGRVGQRTREDIASILTTTDKSTLVNALQGFEDFQRRNTLNALRSARIGAGASAGAAVPLGNYIGSPNQ